MNYLKFARGRVILASFLLSSLLLLAFPAVDIYVSRIFFDKGFRAREQWWQALLHGGMGYFLCLSIAVVAAIYAFNKFSKRALCGVDGKKFLYLCLVLVLGAGLVVNVIFKENFGRARPRDIEEFGGAKHFTPAFVVSHECTSNCSFSSGEGAGAFFAVALALALSRKRAMLLAAVGFGGLVSVSRIAAGAHFFSDTVVSFFVMLTVADVLYYYMILHVPDHRTKRIAVGPGLRGQAIDDRGIREIGAAGIGIVKN